MGTNFYVKGHRHNDNPKYHIGKRSAAGFYCFDCNTTLCKGGVTQIHKGNTEWYSVCPVCGKKPAKESLNNSSAGRELGFNKTKPVLKTGVASCSSFTWARELGNIQKIEDEYGTQYTREEFEEILQECQIIFFNSIGKEFS